MRDVVVAGVGMHPFGRFPDKELEDLGQVAVSRALADAGVTWRDIPLMYAGAMQAGSSWGQRVSNTMGARGIPVINVEAACASGVVGLWQGAQAVASGLYDIVLVVGVEKMPRGFIPTLNLPMWQRLSGLGVYPAFYAQMAQRHMLDFGTTLEQLALVSVKSHKNASLCEYAHFRQYGSLTVEDVLSSKMVCDPLTLLQIAPVSDGAAAAVLCAKEVLPKYYNHPSVYIKTVAVSSGRHDPYALVSPRDIEQETAKQAYEKAGLGPSDLDLVECQDAATIAEIHTTEALGLCPEGEGGRLVQSGATQICGRIPVNTDGGYMSRGNPVGATGLAGIAEIVWQLRGQAGSRQVDGAMCALNETLGAGPTCSVTILSR